MISVDVPTLFEFWAEWCQPCKQQHVELDRLSQIKPDLKIMRYSIEEAPDLVAMWEVKTLPFMVYVEPSKSPLNIAGFATAEKIISRFGI